MILLKQFLTMNTTIRHSRRVQLSYHPKMMLKVDSICLHTICIYQLSKIEKMLNDSIRMMWLSQNQKPSYKTINRKSKSRCFIRIFIYSILQSVCKTKYYR
ncbi:transposase [Staphylococcus aureus]